MVAGFFLFRAVFDPNVVAAEAINPQFAGNIGGLGLPSLVAWPIGGLLAAAVAWGIGKTPLACGPTTWPSPPLASRKSSSRSSRTRTGWPAASRTSSTCPAPGPCPTRSTCSRTRLPRFRLPLGPEPVTTSTIVKLLYAGMFGLVLAAIIWAFERALNSPWGRMMRAIRDNEVSAAAMGKDVTGRHLQVFILGSAVIGFAGAMMTSMDGQLTPGTYNPLRFTFLVWVMVIVGGSGNNWGTVLGGF
jgi:branched-chain amino acid transport system permease protein